MKLAGSAAVFIVWAVGVVGVALALAAGPAAAQPAPSTQPVEVQPAAEPGAVQTAPIEPTTGMKAPKPEEEEAAPPEIEPEVQWGVGARSRFITVPTFMMELFVEHATPMNSYSIAGEVIRRKGNLDIVFTLEYANVSPKDGLWQEKGEDPSMLDMYPDLTKFDSLALLSGDVSFIWHANLTDFMALRYGAGIGIGVPLGGYTHQDTVCTSNTTIDDLDDPNACTPVPGKIDKDNLPPIVPVVNLLLGLRFKVIDQLSLNIEAGWRFPAFFIGGGVGYFF